MLAYTNLCCLVKEILRVNLRAIVASLSSKCSHVGYETFPHWVTIIPTLGTKSKQHTYAWQTHGLLQATLWFTKSNSMVYDE